MLFQSPTGSSKCSQTYSSQAVCASRIGLVVTFLQHWSTAVDKLGPGAYLNVGDEFSLTFSLLLGNMWVYEACFLHTVTQRSAPDVDKVSKMS